MVSSRYSSVYGPRQPAWDVSLSVWSTGVGHIASGGLMETGKAGPWAGHGGLVSTQGLGKWKSEVVGFCGRTREEGMDVSDVGTYWTKPVSLDDLCLHLQLRAGLCSPVCPTLLQLYPTQIAPQSRLPLLRPWVTLRSVDLCWGCRLLLREAFHQVAVTGAHGEYLCPGSGAQERRHSAVSRLVQRGWWQLFLRMTVLPRLRTRFVTEQGIGSCLPESEVLKHQKK